MSTISIASAPRRSVGDAMAAELRAASIVVVSCAVAGAIVGGIGSRVAMRLSALAAPEARGMVTEAGNVVGEITLPGTVGLMLFAGIGSAVFGAGAFTVLRPWLPRRTVRGLVFGLFLLALLGRVVIDPANADFVLLGDRALNVAMFSTLFIAFGLVASGTAAFLEARIARAPALSSRGWAVSLLAAVPIVPGVAGVAFGFAWQLGVPLVTSSLAMAVAGRIDRRARRGAAQRIRIAATAVMATVVLIAGAAYVEDVATIL